MQVIKEVTAADLDDRMSEETKTFVTRFLQTTDPRAITKLPLSVVRETRNNNARLMNAQLNIPDLVEKEFFIKNDKDGFEVPATAYIPSGTKPDSPLVVFFHGGGWTFCSRITHHFSVATLAESSKCIWLSVEYRLGPEFKHPYGLDDCISVTKWAIENKSKELNLNDNVKVGVCGMFSLLNKKLFVSTYFCYLLAGDSAGGTYAATISHCLREQLSFQMLVYPCVHLSIKTNSKEEFSRDCHILIPDVLDFFGKCILNSSEDLNDPTLSPMLHENFSNLPKALIVSAELDPLVDQSFLYKDKLIEHGNSCDLHVIKGVHHGYFNIPLFMPNAFKETMGHFVEFLNKIKS